MNELTEYVDPVTRLDRFQALEPGNYWRAKHEVTTNRAYFSFGVHQGEYVIPEGETLLLMDIRSFDGEAHTAVLRMHPSDGGGAYRFLVDDFLEAFEPNPDGEEVRQKELAAVQGEIEELQAEVLAEQRDPERIEKAIAEDLEHWDRAQARQRERERERELTDQREPNAEKDSGGALVTEHDAAKMAQSDLATIVSSRPDVAGVERLRGVVARVGKTAELRANHMKRRMEEISKALERTAPFLEERAAVALARTQGMRQQAEKISEGLQSLDLYTGKGMSVDTIAKGDSAPADEPLTLFQRKLFMDEELSVFGDVSSRFDFYDTDDFDKMLAENPAFVEQLIPAPRGVVSMAVRRDDLAYEGRHPFEAAMNNLRNRRVFLLVRDGANVHRVWSSQPSHEATPRLFPTRDDFDQLFRGFGIGEITFRHLEFTDSTEKADNLALHYKRFLILLCGLDHRQGLFGRFYPEEKFDQFLSLEFQERYFRFVADDERATLIGEGWPKVTHWIMEMNSYLRSGSRVFALYGGLLKPGTAPGCFIDSNYGRDTNRIARAIEPFGEHIVRTDQKEFVIDVPVDRTELSYRPLKNPKFNARVSLTEAKKMEPFAGFLCLDAVKLDAIEHYIYDREARIHHTGYIRMFKRVAQLLREVERQEADTRKALRKALVDGKLASEEAIEDLVDEAVRIWRADHRGVELAPAGDKNAMQQMLDGMYASINEAKLLPKAKVWAEHFGLKPLRLVLRGKRPVLYVEAPEKDRFETVVEWGWVQAINLRTTMKGVGGLSKTSERLAWLTDKPDARERVIHEWGDCQKWLHGYPEPARPAKAQEMIRSVQRGLADIEDWYRADGPGIPDKEFPSMARRMNRIMWSKHRYVASVYAHVPIGVVYDHRAKKLFYLTILSSARTFFHGVVDKRQWEELREYFTSVYSNTEHANRLFDEPAGTRRLGLLSASEDIEEGFVLNRVVEYPDYDLRKHIKALNSANLPAHVKRLGESGTQEGSSWYLPPETFELVERISPWFEQDKDEDEDEDDDD